MIIFVATVNSLIQVLAFLFISFLVYVLPFRTQRHFITFVGLYRPQLTTVKYSLFAALASLFIMSVPMILIATSDLEPSILIQHELIEHGPTIQGIIIAILLAVIKTSLSEEILFRGFIQKFLLHRFSFAIANTAQAILFGLLHSIGLAVLGVTNTVVLVIAASLVGWIVGYLNEKQGNGSVIPSWIAHGLVNLVSFIGALVILG